MVEILRSASLALSISWYAAAVLCYGSILLSSGFEAMTTTEAAFSPFVGFLGAKRQSCAVGVTPSALLSIAPLLATNTKAARRVVVIGGGWAGFSVVDSLSYDNCCNNSFTIDLLDASPRGLGGLASGWKSKTVNATVEAGLHGFWREYRNTFATIERILAEQQNNNRPQQETRPHQRQRQNPPWMMF